MFSAIKSAPKHQKGLHTNTPITENRRSKGKGEAEQSGIRYSVQPVGCSDTSAALSQGKRYTSLTCRLARYRRDRCATFRLPTLYPSASPFPAICNLQVAYLTLRREQRTERKAYNEKRRIFGIKHRKQRGWKPSTPHGSKRNLKCQTENAITPIEFPVPIHVTSAGISKTQMNSIKTARVIMAVQAVANDVTMTETRRGVQP